MTHQLTLILLTLTLLVLTGCPADTSDHLKIEDGTLTGRFHTKDSDTFSSASEFLVNYIYTNVSKYPDAENIHLDIHHDGDKVGSLTVTSDEVDYIRQTESRQAYKDERLIDYKVALYEGHTPLALTLKQPTLQEIILRSRSADRVEGILGISLRKFDRENELFDQIEQVEPPRSKGLTKRLV